MANKIREMGKLSGIYDIPEEIINECLVYVDKLFALIEEKTPDVNDERYNEVIFSLVDIILIKHLTLSYLQWNSLDK